MPTIDVREAYIGTNYLQAGYAGVDIQQVHISDNIGNIRSNMLYSTTDDTDYSIGPDDVIVGPGTYHCTSMFIIDSAARIGGKKYLAGDRLTMGEALKDLEL